MKKSAGFTLIELLIVIAIVGILAAIAYPSYQGAVIKSHRTDAMGDLINFQSAMERHYTVNNSYTGAANGGADTGSPNIFSTVSPSDGGTAVYNLTIFSAADASFAIRATPIAGLIQDGDGYLELLHTDQRRWNKSSGLVNTWD